MKRSAGFLAVMALCACSSEVASNNPFDPSSPAQAQARARVAGILVAPTLESPQGLVVVLKSNNRKIRDVAADPDGAFGFEDLAPGSYAVECAPDGFLPLVVPVALGAGDDLDLGSLTLTPLSQSSAIVGTATLADQPEHAGTLVEAVGRPFTAVTGTAGAFRMAVLPGTYRLRLTHQDFLETFVEGVVVGRGEEVDVGTVALLGNPAIIHGHVDMELPGGGRGPANGAEVSLLGTSRTGRTNAAGDFTLDSVAPGSYLVVAHLDGGYVDASQPALNVKGGEERSLESPFYLGRARGGIAGTVRLADSSDSRDVLVEVTGAGRTQKTGASGRFVFADLVVGTYQLAASKDGYAPRVLGTWTVAADAVTEVGQFTLPRQGGAVTIAEAPYSRSLVVTLSLSAAGAIGFHMSEDPSFADTSLGDHATDPWRPYTPGAPVPFTLRHDVDGEHRVHVSFFDGVAVSAPASALVVLDRLGPGSPTVAVGAGGPFTNAPGGLVSLALGAVDQPRDEGAAVSGLDKMQLSNRPDFAGATTLDFNRTAAWTLDAASVDGSKVVYARFTDRAGNQSDAASAAVVLDTRPPESASISLGASLTTSPLVTATLSASDQSGGSGNSDLLVRLSNTSGMGGARYQPFESQVSWLLSPGDGDKTVYAQFMDPAGNESLVASALVTLDTGAPTAPAIAIVESDGRSDNGFTRSRQVTLRLWAGREPAYAVVSENVSLSGGTEVPMDELPQPVSASFTLGGLGTRTVWARFFDEAGNGSALAAASVVVDEAPPGVPLSVTLTDGDEVKTLNVSYRDLADNTTDLTPLLVQLDGTQPAAVNFTVRGTLADGSTSASLTARTAVTLDLSAQTDLLSGLEEIKLSNLPALTDASWQPFVASRALPWLLTPSDGRKVVYAQLRDVAGNESGVVQGSIELAAAPPSSSSLLIAGGADTTTDRYVRLDISAVGASEMAWSTDGFSTAPAWSPYATSVGGVDLGAVDQMTKVVSMRFRNRARVEGAAVAAAIYADRTPPRAGTLALVGSLGNGTASSTWTSNPAIVAQPSIAAEDGDVAHAAFAQPAQGQSCAEALAAPAWQPYARNATVVLSGGDGPKQVCALLADRAGNFSNANAAEASIILDTTAPTNPSFVGLSSGVTSARIVTAAITESTDEQSAVTYQCLGGVEYGPEWKDCAGSPPFTFTLLRDQANHLAVRARDQAFNASPGSAVQLVQDGVTPATPLVTSVRSTSSTIALEWDSSASPDVVRYLVRYGNAPDDILGNGAAQGPSPVNAGAATAMVLTDLQPGVTYYLSVVAVDAAGNMSDPSGVRVAVTYKVNPRLLSSFGSDLVALTARGDRAYVGQHQGLIQLDVSNDGATPTVVGRATLPALVPIRLLTGPCELDGASSDCVYVSGGLTTGAAPKPAGISVVYFPRTGTSSAPIAGETVASLSVPAQRMVLSADGAVLYVLTEEELRVYSVADPRLPLLRGAARYEAGGTFAAPRMTPGGAGLVGQTLVVYARPKVSNPPPARLVGFDVSDPYGGIAVQAYAVPLGSDGAAVTEGYAAIGGGEVYLAYCRGGSIFGSCTFTNNSTTFYVGRYAPGGARYPDAETSLVVATYPTVRQLRSASVGQFGLYLMFGSAETQAGRQITTAGGTLALGSPVPGPGSFLYDPAFATFGAGEHIFALDSALLRRWRVGPDAVTDLRGAFDDTRGSLIAEAQGFLVVMKDRTLTTVDVSNPLIPRPVASYTMAGTQASRAYSSLVTRGDVVLAGVVYAGTASGFDVLRVRPDGTLALLGNAGSSITGIALAVVGRHVFVATGGSGVAVPALQVYDIAPTTQASPQPPALVASLNTPSGWAMKALDARGSVIYAAMENQSSNLYGDFQTWGWDGSSVTPLSAKISPPGAALSYPGVISVTVRGEKALLGTLTSTLVVDVSDAASPAFESRTYAVAGPVLFQGGYLVGFDRVGGGEGGPRFVAYEGGAVEGAVPFSSCAQEQGGGYGKAGLVSVSGVYALGCLGTGVQLFSAADPLGGRLLKRLDTSTFYSPLASDGAFAFLAQLPYGANQRTLWHDDNRSLPSVDPSATQPVFNQPWDNALSDDPVSITYADGTNFVVGEWGRVIAYDISRGPARPWIKRGGVDLPQLYAKPTNVPATDGQFLYVPVKHYSSTHASVHVVDLRRPAAPAVAASIAAPNYDDSFEGVAVHRGRLYASHYFWAAANIEDWRVSIWEISPLQASPPPLTPVILGPRTNGYEEVNDVTVSGRTLFFTFKLWSGGYGVGVVRLGPNGDGDGAEMLASLPSDVELGEPVVVGDTLYVRKGRGIVTYDLRPLWRRGEPPVFRASRGLIESGSSEGRFFVDGPWAYMFAGSYRVFDLR